MARLSSVDAPMTPAATASIATPDIDDLELQGEGESLDDLAAALPSDGVTSILEVGCGSGAVARAVARRFGRRVRVTGLDISPRHVAFAEAVARSQGLEWISFVVGDILDVGVASSLYQRFDLVFCRYLLMYMLPDARAKLFLSQMQRCTRPGGLVACIEADINFGQDRYPPPSPRLARALSRVLDYYRRVELVDWRAGVGLYHRLLDTSLVEVTVRLAACRVIQGGVPSALAEHDGRGLEDLLRPCLEDSGEVDQVESLADEWRAYLRRKDTFLYTPVFLGYGRVPTTPA